MTVILENTRNVQRHCRNPKGKPTGPISMISSRLRIQKLIDLPNRKGFGTTLSPCVKTTGVSPLKDNGRLFNSPKDKADILNRQHKSVFTHEDPTSLFQTQMVTLTRTCNKSR